MTKPNKPPAPAETDSRLAPDPFAVVLPALSALGAIASIATVAWAAQDRTPDRAKSRRKASIALRELESCAMGLAEIFRRFQRHPKLFAGEGGQGASPMKFGVHGPRVGTDGARLYLQLMNDVASMLVIASQNAFDVMCAVEDGEIVAPDTLFFGFGECQEQLNGLVQTRASLKTCVETGGLVAGRLASLVRELRACRKD